MLDTILRTYFLSNFFIAGYYFAKQYYSNDELADKIKSYLWAVVTCCFGLIIAISVLLYACVAHLLEKLDGVFQLRFLLHYFVLNKWHNTETETLQRINHICTTAKTKNTIKDRIYRYSVGLINKRNNYTYQVVK